MKVTEKFKEFEDRLNNKLNEAGFNRLRNNFILKQGEDFGLINIQKSKSSSGDLIKFTFNIGIFLKDLSIFYNDHEKKISIDDCHWQKRIGFFLPDSNDIWFEISCNTSIDILLDSVLNMLKNNVFPELQKLLQSNGLLSTWLENKNTHVTEFERLLNLSVLMTKNKHPQTNMIITDLINYANKRHLSIDLHLQKLNEIQ